MSGIKVLKLKISDKFPKILQTLYLGPKQKHNDTVASVDSGSNVGYKNDYELIHLLS